MGVLPVALLKRSRKYAVLGAFVVAAFLTPDVVSMILMAVPLMVLYEIGILGGTMLTRRKKAQETAESK
jgi:sec-independent protein translocase protein TatC